MEFGVGFTICQSRNHVNPSLVRKFHSFSYPLKSEEDPREAALLRSNLLRTSHPRTVSHPRTTPPGIQVSRRACRFERYKSPCRPHPPPHVSRVSCRLPQVSDLTFAHPLLTQPRSPLPTAVRSTNRVTLCGSILGPWAARPKWAPTTVSFLGCTAHEGKFGSKCNSELGSSLPRLIFSPLNLSRRLLSTVVIHPPVFFFSKSYASLSPFARP